MSIVNNCVVNYKLSSNDAEKINKRRTTSLSIKERIEEELWPLGAQAHIGNEATEGQILPMVITAVHSESCVNGQVFLDGNDTLWVTSVLQGNEPGNWNYCMCD
jgi:hypothetical protein